MRKIVASLFMSLDGVMEAPETWAFAYSNDEMEHAEANEMAAADALLLGRKTYEEFAAFWPYQPTAHPVAKFINSVPKYVVSTTLDQVGWQNSVLIRGDLTAELGRLKARPGRNMIVSGSATLVQSLLRDHLLDELRLMIPPVIIGHGKRLFPDARGRQPLRLVNATTFSTGVLHLTYQVTDAQPADEGRVR